MTQLPVAIPDVTTNPADWLPAGTEDELRALVRDFPAIFGKAVKDWSTFRAGLDADLFSLKQQETVYEWYREFPRLWDTIKPNFSPTVRTDHGSVLMPGNKAFYDTVEAWVVKLRTDLAPRGLGQVIIIAGIIIAAIAGIAGALWAVGYIKEQNNVSNMINETVAGKLPPTILEEYYKQDRSTLPSPGEVLSGVANLGTLALIGVGLYFAWPFLKGVFDGRE